MSTMTTPKSSATLTPTSSDALVSLWWSLVLFVGTTATLYLVPSSRPFRFSTTKDLAAADADEEIDGSTPSATNEDVLAISKNERSNSIPTKEEVLMLRQKYFSSCQSISYINSDPLMIVKGRGCHLIDERGTSYLDTRNNVAHVGHGHPHVVAAIQRQVATLTTNTRYLHPLVTALAHTLVQDGWLPSPLTRVFFVNSGSEANDLALRLARAAANRRHNIHLTNENGRRHHTIVVDHAYHGHTLATLEVSPYKYECGTEYPVDDVHAQESMGMSPFDNASSFRSPRRHPGSHVWKVPCPDTYRGVHRAADTADPGAAYASYVEKACNTITKEKRMIVRAFVVEGGMSVGGVILPPPGYLARCAKAVRAAGGVYIADEVQTGFGRFGTSTWAFQHRGSDDPNKSPTSDNDVVPDILTVGKPFGNGMPLAMVATTVDIATAFENCGVEYFNTFGGNPVSAAAGLAVLQVIRQEGLMENAVDVGRYLRTQFRRLQQTTTPLIGDVRGAGLFIGIELVLDPLTLEPATHETSFIVTVLKEKYLILTSIDGPHENVIVIKPPMVFSREDADHLCQSFEKAVVTDLAATQGLESQSKTST